MLGVNTVRRWATVMVISSIPDVPDELVALALRRAHMCEILAGSALPEERETLFTIGLFSVADALLDAPMADVLDTLPFTEEIQAALLRREGPKGELLAAVIAYERGEFPTLPTTDASPSLAGAYRSALAWADEAGRVVALAAAPAAAPRARPHRAAPRRRTAPPHPHRAAPHRATHAAPAPHRTRTRSPRRHRTRTPRRAAPRRPRRDRSAPTRAPPPSRCGASQRAGVADRGHDIRALGDQRAGAGVERRARGVDVVDEDRQRRRRAAHAHEQPARRAALAAARADLARRAVLAHQAVRQRPLDPARERDGEHPRRVEAARAPARRQRGHGHEHGRRVAQRRAGRFAAMCAAIRSAAGSAPRNFSAPTSRRATPS